jgi:aspartyl-tRNA(Asn)/glutamyl-tRNA(Gln) amidotransferase subunit C
MAIDRDTVTRVAFLARLEIDDAQKDAMTHDLSNILTFVEALNDVDASGVEPMTSVVEAYAPLREDKVTDGGYPDKVLKNAPDRVQDFYAVPKVVE